MLLAIETSCDECSAAVVSKGASFVEVKSNVVFSQIDLHRKFGGVVPEVASRNHLEMIIPVIEEALEKAKISFSDLTAIAVTNRPGLIGALLVGVSVAKTLAYSLKIPLVAVDHLQGHLHSLFVDGQKSISTPLTKDHTPLLVCLVSGGHTNLYLLENIPPLPLRTTLLGSSKDDAAGEAFDKSAKLLGLPYPGGVFLDRYAKTGNAKAYALPRPLLDSSLDFSFSGLKTAVRTWLIKNGYEPHGVGKSWGHEVDQTKLPKDQVLADLSASIQEAIVDVLLYKIESALKQTGAKGLAIVGGVSANSRLRQLVTEKINIPVFYPSLEYCTDNAAMIGACAYYQFLRGEYLTGSSLLNLNASSSSVQ